MLLTGDYNDRSGSPNRISAVHHTGEVQKAWKDSSSIFSQPLIVFVVKHPLLAFGLKIRSTWKLQIRDEGFLNCQTERKIVCIMAAGMSLTYDWALDSENFSSCIRTGANRPILDRAAPK